MDDYLAEIRIFAGNYAPRNWRFCDGSLLNINDYEELYSLLGNRFGGSAPSTFALPDLRGRVPVGTGAGIGLHNWILGQSGGYGYLPISAQNLPAHTHGVPSHTHALYAKSGAGSSVTPQNCVMANSGQPKYGPPTSLAKMSASSIGAPSTTHTDVAGGSQPVFAYQPSMGMSYIICVKGLYPSRD